MSERTDDERVDCPWKCAPDTPGCLCAAVNASDPMLRALTHEYAKQAPTGYQPPRKEER